MSEDVLDLNEFLERVQNDKGLVLELLDIFVDDFREKRRQLDEAVAKNDNEQIKRLSHSLKGSSGNISAKPLRVSFLQLEEMGKKNDLTDAGAILGDIDRKFTELSARIATLKEELK